MKKLILTIFIAMLGLLLASCDRDITEATLNDNPAKPTASDVTFTGSFNVNYADSLVKFAWSAVDFGFQASTTYTVELSPSSTFASNVATLITSQSLSGTAKVSEINTLILSWNYDIGTAVTVYYRVGATVTSSLATIYSDTKSKIFTPYDAVINYPMLYVPGAYQGWSPGAENGRLYSYGFNTTYSGIIRIISGTDASSEFKITNAADWNHTNWGGTLTKTINNYSGTLDASGGNLAVTAGCYVITVNTSTLAITLNKTEDWGVIGSACSTGWNSDLNMFYNGQRQMWEITDNFSVGEIKFRANDGWDINYGDTGADGILNSGGDNIAISTAGNYTIRFSTETLKYTVKKN
jgi:starch-binding outer membrane protein SusE/F